MKIRHIVVAASTALLLTTGNAWAANDHGAAPVILKSVSHVTPKPACHVKPPKKHKGHHKVPEINAANGTSAIALMAGVLLLAGERVRSRRA
jgi:hypothetical protein